MFPHPHDRDDNDEVPVIPFCLLFLIVGITFCLERSTRFGGIIFVTAVMVVIAVRFLYNLSVSWRSADMDITSMDREQHLLPFKPRVSLAEQIVMLGPSGFVGLLLITIFLTFIFGTGSYLLLPFNLVKGVLFLLAVTTIAPLLICCFVGRRLQIAQRPNPLPVVPNN